MAAQPLYEARCALRQRVAVPPYDDTEPVATTCIGCGADTFELTDSRESH
jgi:hypothetical protein